MGTVYLSCSPSEHKGIWGFHKPPSETNDPVAFRKLGSVYTKKKKKKNQEASQHGEKNGIFSAWTTSCYVLLYILLEFSVSVSSSVRGNINSPTGFTSGGCDRTKWDRVCPTCLVRGGREERKRKKQARQGGNFLKTRTSTSWLWKPNNFYYKLGDILHGVTIQKLYFIMYMIYVYINTFRFHIHTLSPNIFSLAGFGFWHHNAGIPASWEP